MSQQILYYLGPKYTFSYANALEVQKSLSDWEECILEPCSSADEIFQKLQTSNGRAGTIIPTFNTAQGIVHDFVRFYLFDTVWERKSKIHLALFSQEKSMQTIRKLITKDTIIPQVSHWLATLPPHIKIEATPHISTAASAKRAAQEPQTAAICSPLAGKTYANLNCLADHLSNDPNNYTIFKLFVRPDTYWHNSELFSSPEHPLHFTDALAHRLKQGDCTILWHKSARTTLHLGHYSNLLTLRKLAIWGNHINIALGTQLVAMTEPIREEIGRMFPANSNLTFTPYGEGEQLPSADIIVSGIEHIEQYKAAGQPAILIDTLPGTDGYAKMATLRGNTIPWLEPSYLQELPSLFVHHFSPERLAQAQL